MRPASVLIPVIAREDGLSVMFTRRTAHRLSSLEYRRQKGC